MNVIQAQIQPITTEGYACVIAAIIVVGVSFWLWGEAKTRWKKGGHLSRSGLGADLIAVAMVAMVALILGLIFLQAQILPIAPAGYSCVIGAIIAVVAFLLLWRGTKALWKKDGHRDKGLRNDMYAMAMFAGMIGLVLLFLLRG